MISFGEVVENDKGEARTYGWTEAADIEAFYPQVLLFI